MTCVFLEFEYNIFGIRWKRLCTFEWNQKKLKKNYLSNTVSFYMIQFNSIMWVFNKMATSYWCVFSTIISSPEFTSIFIYESVHLHIYILFNHLLNFCAHPSSYFLLVWSNELVVALCWDGNNFIALLCTVIDIGFRTFSNWFGLCL